MADFPEQGLEFFDCGLNHLVVPHLSSFLRANDRLRRFAVDGDDPDHTADLFAGPALREFCEALRSSHVEALHVRACGLWNSVDDGCALVRACRSHPTVTELSFANNTSDHLPMCEREKVGGAFASLVSVKSAIASLDVFWNDLFDPELEIAGTFLQVRG